MAGMSSIVCDERYPQKWVGRTEAHSHLPRLFTKPLPCQTYNHTIWYSSRFLHYCILPTKNQIVPLLLSSSPHAVENEVVEADSSISIKDASGTWPIDKRRRIKEICDAIENGTEDGRRVGVVISEFVDRFFRDEDRIDSNVFIKICRENDCYVHISSKRMTYNFANPQHAELFRLEVQMAAAYIENHVRGTMLRRRQLSAESGQWAGLGAVPVNFIVDKRKESKTYGKLIPDPPHIEVSLELYDRTIELAFDLDALCLELAEKAYIYHEFEEWVYKGDYTIRTALHKAPGGEGYALTRDGLEYMLTNIVNIGAIKRNGKIIYNHHEAIIDQDRFWLVYDNLKLTRPDGTPTGKPILVRYTQQRNLRAALVTKPLLKPVTTHTNGSVYFSRNGKTGAGNYAISVRRGLVHDYLLCVNAVQLEEAIVDRMFEHLQTVDIGDLKAARKQRGEKIARRLAEITRDVGVIDEELARLHEVFPGERDRLAIMRAFPDRSWRAIRHMADSLGLTAGKGQDKGKGVRFQKGQIESLNLSWNDVRWLAASGLTLKSFSSNQIGWSSSCSSRSVFSPAGWPRGRYNQREADSEKSRAAAPSAARRWMAQSWLHPPSSESFVMVSGRIDVNICSIY